MELKFLSSIVLIPIVIYIISFSLIAYNTDYYSDVIINHGDDIELGLSVTPKLVNYFQGGEIPSEFTLKEAEHMKDVKFLFKGFIYFMMICFILLLFISDRKSIFYGSLIGLALPVVLYLLPFEFLFNLFHQVFFSRGTWIFDENSILILMYPLNFFYNIFFNIVLRGWMISFIMLFLSKF